MIPIQKVKRCEFGNPPKAEVASRDEWVSFTPVLMFGMIGRLGQCIITMTKGSNHPEGPNGQGIHKGTLQTSMLPSKSL